MTRDNQNKISKKELVKKSKKRDEVVRRKKSNEQSDDDSQEYISSDDDEEEMDMVEYRKLLGKLFPSKHMDKKISADKNIQKLIKKMQEDEDEEEEAEIKSSKKNKASKKKVSKRIVEESEEESEEEEEEGEEEPGAGKFNIIFTIGQPGNDEDEWEDEEDSEWEDDEDTEDEDESVSSDEDSDEDDAEEEDDEEEEEEEDEPKNKKISKKNKKVHEVGKKKKGKKEKLEKVEEGEEGEDEEGQEESKDEEEPEEEDDAAVLQHLKELQGKKKSKAIAECIKVCEDKIKAKTKKVEKKMKKQKAKNGRIFKKIIRDKNTMNDFAFFEKLDHTEQVKIIKEVREVNKITRVEKPYRITLLESSIPAHFKAAAMKKISSLRYMEPGSGEFYKIKSWVDTFMRIPFNKVETLPVNISDGIEACHEFMANAQATLDAAVYGLNDAKMQIMQMLGQLVTNPTAIGSAIAIKGPMGTGKTTLVKEGISKILNRPFAFIALGGATDSSFLEGHSYTYEGSVWGKIVQILIDSKCMNPVIYFDELDKISDTPKGEEIAGILTHLTDTSQNSQFHDKYFAEIDFDLSKCLFIFSYNDESKVNPILRDRMYRIQTKGYDKKQKTTISCDYLLPKIREQIKFQEEDIIIPTESLHYIIETHCETEDGVRNLKRCLEIIYTKLNLYRLMKPGSNLFEGEMSLTVSFPFTVTKEVVDKLIKKENDINMSLRSMYV
uniref:ATPase AAA-type core domain-containing protein n=1 Tax=viral metagenome TaxID=1070528 RepID=A0A6C0B0F6_9ZZZZ